MESILSAVAFALIIGGQFLAALVVGSKRRTIYGMERPKEAKHPPSEGTLRPVVRQDLREAA